MKRKVSKPKVLVLGAGYGGLMTVLGLQRQLLNGEAEITLVDQNPYHYFTTRLHEPAAGTSHHDHVRINIDKLIDKRKVDFVCDKIKSIDHKAQQVVLQNATLPLSYDYLVIALGSSAETFGIPGLAENALGIRDIKSARRICSHIEHNFACYSVDPKPELITIVVGGAGFTGVEYLGELIDRMPHLCREYDVQPSDVRIINIEAAPTLMPGFDPELIDYAKCYLKKNNVELILGTPIESCQKGKVVLKGGREIKSAAIIWTGGVRGNQVGEDSGLTSTRGRLQVDKYLCAVDHQNLFVLGDSALFMNNEGRPYPPTAQMATQQGKAMANNLVNLLRGREMRPFQYQPKGTVASLGKNDAMGIVGKYKIFGWKAALMKRFIDLSWLYMLGGFRLVMRKGFL